MKFENTDVWGFEHALRGMRNPLESWNKSDSNYLTGCSYIDNLKYPCRCSKYEIGKNDLELAQRLIKAGSEHRKFMRQIFVSVDITAPLYWWKEFDTYKVGTVTNSTSTMHKLASIPITKECFEMDDFEDVFLDMPISEYWEKDVEICEFLRRKYNETKDKRYWKELIRKLPESWLQKRTVTMSYENVLNMVHQRKNHKLTEWSESFIEWSKSLPYADEFLFLKESYNKTEVN